MKPLFTLVILVFLTVGALAQAPEKFSYQAVVRDANQALVTSSTVSVRISLLQGSGMGVLEYQETHSANTNGNGLLTLEIGDGTVTSGDFSTLDWANGPWFLQTEIDPTGGANYTISGTTQLLSVPFALHATSAETATSLDGGELDPVFGASLASGITAADTAHWNQQTVDTQIDSAGIAALGFVAGPHTVDTDDQTLSLSGDSLSITDGNTIDLSVIDTDTDDQTLSLSGTTLSIADGNSVNLASIDTDTQLDSAGVAALGFVAGPQTVNTDNQNLTLSGNSLSISGGNSVNLSSLNTDTDDQTLSLSGTTLSIADGNSVNLASLDTDTDDQTLSLSGTTLSIADGNSVNLASIDTDTQLDSAGVAALGFVAGPQTVNTDNQNLTLSGNSLSISGGNSVNLSSLGTDTDDQTLSLSGTTLSIADGNSVDLASIDSDTDDQTLSLSGTTLSIADGNSVDLSSIDSDTDDQTLSLSGTTLSIADGNSIDLASLDTDTQLDSAGIAALGYVAGSAPVPGSNMQVTFNDSGSTGADADLVYNKTTNQMGIGTSSVSSGAALEVNSTTGGILLPRLTSTQRDLLSPKVGTVIFNADSGKFQGYAGFEGSTDVEFSHHTFKGNLTMCGQSFTAMSNGNLAKLTLEFQTGGSDTLKIYSGHGIAGALLHSQAITVGSGVQEITLTNTIQLVAGQQYTFAFNTLACGYYPFGTYGGGSAFTTGLSFPGDLWFKVITGGAEWVNLH